MHRRLIAYFIQSIHSVYFSYSSNKRHIYYIDRHADAALRLGQHVNSCACAQSEEGFGNTSQGRQTRLVAICLLAANKKTISLGALVSYNSGVGAIGGNDNAIDARWTC